jgi:outer membrane lipoprotein-sorting protein
LSAISGSRRGGGNNRVHLNGWQRHQETQGRRICSTSTNQHKSLLCVKESIKSMTNAKNKLALAISGAIMLASGATTVVLSNDMASDDLSSSQILQKAQANYASLTSYSDEGQIVATMSTTTITTSFTIRLARPNYYRIEWEQTIEPSYSTTKTQVQVVWSLGVGNFLEMGDGPQNEETRYIALAKATEISGGAAGTIPRTFFNMQWGDPLGGSVFSENRQTDEKVGPVDCYVFTRKLDDQTRTLWIGKRDFLIHQVRTVTTADAMQVLLNRAVKGNHQIISDIHGFTTTETHTHIVVNKQFLRSDFVPANGE